MREKLRAVSWLHAREEEAEKLTGGNLSCSELQHVCASDVPRWTRGTITVHKHGLSIAND